MLNQVQFLTASKGFKIDHSFSLDGINKYFTIPNAALGSVLSGASKKFTINILVKRGSIGTNQGIIAAWDAGQQSILFRFNTTNKLNFLMKDGAVTKSATSTNSFTDTSNFIWITLSYDASLTLGNRTQFKVNGIAESTSSDTTTANIDTGTSLYHIGSQTGTTNTLDGNQSLLFIRDDMTTTIESLADYNAGKPLSGLITYGANCVYQFNPDKSGATAQFSVLDSVNSITATSVNLINSDKTTVTPY